MEILILPLTDLLEGDSYRTFSRALRLLVVGRDLLVQKIGGHLPKETLLQKIGEAIIMPGGNRLEDGMSLRINQLIGYQSF